MSSSACRRRRRTQRGVGRRRKRTALTRLDQSCVCARARSRDGCACLRDGVRVLARTGERGPVPACSWPRTVPAPPLRGPPGGRAPPARGAPRLRWPAVESAPRNRRLRQFEGPLAIKSILYGNRRDTCSLARSWARRSLTSSLAKFFSLVRTEE